MERRRPDATPECTHSRRNRGVTDLTLLRPQIGYYRRGRSSAGLTRLSQLEMEKAQYLAEEAMRVAERLGDAARLVAAHITLGVVLFHQGKLE